LNSMLWERCLAMAFILRKPGSPGQFLARKMSTAMGALQRGDGINPWNDLPRPASLHEWRRRFSLSRKEARRRALPARAPPPRPLEEGSGFHHSVTPCARDRQDSSWRDCPYQPRSAQGGDAVVAVDVAIDRFDIAVAVATVKVFSRGPGDGVRSWLCGRSNGGCSQIERASHSANVAALMAGTTARTVTMEPTPK
jgi:hypothetical protein